MTPKCQKPVPLRKGPAQGRKTNMNIAHSSNSCKLQGCKSAVNREQEMLRGAINESRGYRAAATGIIMPNQ